jgi:fluoroacetyl-CoA thioesterase
MIDTSKFTLDLVGRSEMIVAEEHTARWIGSARVHVLATPVMINLMEAAALNAVENLMPVGFQSLGTRLDIRHIAATPVGMRVHAVAKLIKVTGRTLEFWVEAHDQRELIGDGSHQRVIVNVHRFDQRLQAKILSI